MTAFLPQHEPFFSGWIRNLRMRWDRRLYRYDYSHVSPLALVKHLPILDEFSFEWLGIVAVRVLDAVANRSELELSGRHREHHTTKHKRLTALLEIGETSILEIKNLVMEVLRFDGRFGAPSNPRRDRGRVRRTFSLVRLASDRQRFCGRSRVCSQARRRTEPGHAAATEVFG